VLCIQHGERRTCIQTIDHFYKDTKWQQNQSFMKRESTKCYTTHVKHDHQYGRNFKIQEIKFQQNKTQKVNCRVIPKVPTFCQKFGTYCHVDSVTVFMTSLVIEPRILLIKNMCRTYFGWYILLSTIKQMKNWCKNNNEKWF
jgi:hypothetical protein